MDASALTAMVTDFLVSTSASALVAGYSATIQSLKRRRADVTQVHTLLARNNSLKAIIQQSIPDISHHCGRLSPQEQEELRSFLRSTEVQGVITKTFLARKSSAVHRCLDVEREFYELLSFRLSKPIDEVNWLGATLYATIRDYCIAAFELAVDNQNLSAHEALSNYRHQELLSQLDVNRRFLCSLLSQEGTDHALLDRKCTQYCEQVLYKHRFISASHLKEERRIPFDDIYIESDIYSRSTDRERLALWVALEDIISQPSSLVLLGGPGSGKSTLCRKLSRLIACLYSSPESPGEVIPILIELKTLGKWKKSNLDSIVKYVVQSCNAELEAEFTEDEIRYLLLYGRIVIMLDGFDELTETQSRRQIRDAIELFHNKYPRISIIVTSRTVGYEQAALDKERFVRFDLSQFSREQISEYVQKWFRCEYFGDTVSKANKQASEFLRATKGYAELIPIPLMLNLLLSVYKGPKDLPSNRPELYELCAEMLFEKWDKSKELYVKYKYTEFMKPVLAFLAYEVYVTATHSHAIPLSELIRLAKKYMREYFDSEHEAIAAATEFVDYCRGRAWVFTDQGTTAEGEDLYMFTHRTFMEYFAATYIVMKWNTEASLIRKLYPRIRKREWDIVCQIAIQKKKTEIEYGGDKLITRICNRAYRDTLHESIYALLFVLEMCEYMYIKPMTLREAGAVLFVRAALALRYAGVEEAIDVLEAIEEEVPDEPVSEEFHEELFGQVLSSLPPLSREDIELALNDVRLTASSREHVLSWFEESVDTLD